MKPISFIFFIFLINLPVHAIPTQSRNSVRNDTSYVSYRAFESKLIKAYKADPDYRYGRSREGLSALDRFWFWLLMLLARVMSFFIGTLVGQIIFYVLCAGAILFVILKLLNIDVRDLFFKSSSGKRQILKATEENIHGLDFERLISEAVQQNEYREAVRLVFLFSLKKLSDARLIEWTPGKTNDEYMAELARHPSRQRLQELRYYFDYAWYGHFEINKTTYASVQKTFREFDATLS